MCTCYRIVGHSDVSSEDRHDGMPLISPSLLFSCTRVNEMRDLGRIILKTWGSSAHLTSTCPHDISEIWGRLWVASLGLLQVPRNNPNSINVPHSCISADLPGYSFATFLSLSVESKPCCTTSSMYRGCTHRLSNTRNMGLLG